MIYIELVHKSKTGDSDSFAKLIKIYEKDLYRVAIAMVKNNDDALDCIQDTILKAYKNINKLNNEAYFKTWLIKILINKCNTVISKNKRFTSLSSINSEPSYSDNFNQVEVSDIVDKLDHTLKILVTLYYYEDMSIKEISESLHIPEGTIKSRLSRARGQLKSMLDDEYSEVL
ncbi:MAG: sigma-70 family RNA polymerase sigma factor [Clostridium sp.]|uniref:RNA polymerase sigma factor n=1 Tax=Clostridium sp. TaxID=1506 RepID=UPI003031E597